MQELQFKTQNVSIKMNKSILYCFILFSIMVSLRAKHISSDSLIPFMMDASDEDVNLGQESSGPQKRFIEFKRIIDFKRELKDELDSISQYEQQLAQLNKLLNQEDSRHKRPSISSGTRAIHGTRSFN